MKIKKIMEVLEEVISGEKDIEVTKPLLDFDESGETSFFTENYRFCFYTENGEIQSTSSVIEFSDLRRKDIRGSIFDFTDENDPVVLLNASELISLEKMLKE